MILITGAGGFVGCRAMERFPGATPFPGALARSDDPQAILDFVERMHPSVIYHTAAISDIGACEKDPQASYRANVLLPVALARAANAVRAKLVCFSSDQVYTGCQGDQPFAEDQSLPEPVNMYARHKLEAEKRVLDILPDAVMLRATWMYDLPKYGCPNRGNFLMNLLEAALQGRTMTCSRMEHRGITYVRQVVELLDQAAELPGGAYNYGSENCLHMYDTALALLQALGLSHLEKTLLVETEARRRNLWMDGSRLRRHGIRFDSTAQGFQRCAADYGLRPGVQA